MSEPLFSLVTIVGPLLLALLLLMAFARTRRASPREVARSSRATQALYREIYARDQRRNARNV